MWRMRMAIVAAAMLVGCGARDQLYVGEPLPQPGGMGGIGGMGGSGGIGGMSPPGGCSSVELVEPIARPLDGTMALQVLSPQLTFTDTDSTTAVLVASYQPPGSLAELRHTAFEPWDAWPQDGLFEPGHLIDNSGVTNFTAARGIEGRFAVSFINAEPNPTGLVTGIDYLAHAPQPSAVGGTVAPNAARLLDSGHGVRAFTQPWSDELQQLYLLLPFQVDNGFQWSGPYVVGCTVGAPMAAAVGTFDGGLIAAHQGSHIGDGCAATNPSEPDNIVTGRVLYGGDTDWTIGADFNTAPLLAMHMTSDGEGGGWLMWQTSEELSTLRAVRLNDNAQQISGNMSIAAPVLGRWGMSFNAGVLWVADVSPKGELRVWRFNTEGDLLSTGSASIGAPGQGPVEVLVAPDGEQAVVAFSEQGEQGEAVRVAKFACPPP